MIGAVLLSCALVAVDGDSLRCGRERIRLVGIDAPERRGCPRGRRCAPGDPLRSTAMLAVRLGGHARIVRLGRDHYGRTIAAVRVGGIDLSCHQLRVRAAIYRADWDSHGTVRRRCPDVAR